MNKVKKEKKIGLKILLVLLSLLFLFVAIQKVLGVDEMIKNMAALKYNYSTTVFIGVLEIAAVVCLWFSKLRKISLMILLIILAGAVGSHLAGGHPVVQVIPHFIFSTLIVLSLFLDDKEAFKSYFLNYKQI